jgi:hypothetical protein
VVCFPTWAGTISEPGSSVIIVPGYELDDRAIVVRSLAEAKGFFALASCVQTGSGAHPASCTICTGGPIPGAKARPGRDVDNFNVKEFQRFNIIFAWLCQTKFKENCLTTLGHS